MAEINKLKENYKDRVVLVTGATGFTGSLLVEKLVKLGARVKAVSRPSSNRKALSHLNIEWYSGQVYDKAVLSSAVQDVEYIFHVAAAFREAKILESEYARVHLDSTKLLAELALNEKNFKRLIHVSTMGVHGHIENPPGSENSAYAPGDEYQRTKLEAELWLHDYAKANSLAYTVIRPTAIFGPGDRRLLKIFKMASKPIFPILGWGKCWYHLIHVDDLTDAILLAGQTANALSETFIIGNSEAIKLAEMAKFISQELGHKTKIFRLPVSPFFS
ncbi:MAG: NAD-dependent epimerase/dehydratase family protein [Bdellovibrionota bacterium]